MRSLLRGRRLLTLCAVLGMMLVVASTVAEDATGLAITGAAAEKSSTVPSAPRSVTVGDVSNGDIRVSWRSPASRGGGFITGYEIRIDDRVRLVGRFRRSATFADIAPGSHTVSVVASNRHGDGPAVVVLFENIDAPGPPRKIDSGVRNQTVTITWTRPADDGGELDGYEVRLGSQRINVGPDDEVELRDVEPGDYKIRVRAKNSAGSSRWVDAPAVVVPAVFDPFDNGRDFLDQQYRDFLGRAPDEYGLRFWATRLDVDPRMATVIASFLQSPELASERRMARLYLALFDRAPDRSGYRFWVEQLDGGRSLSSISELFVQSAEFAERYGSLSNGEFVVLTYNRVLARQVDNGGFQYWVRRLDEGMTRGELISQFAESSEFVGISGPAVDLIVSYQSLLHRPPRHDELLPALAQVSEAGGSLETVIDAVLASDEYRARIAR